jgi:hypothetical protein
VTRVGVLFRERQGRIEDSVGKISPDDARKQGRQADVAIEYRRLVGGSSCCFECFGE